jgi:hypothetical protein
MAKDNSTMVVLGGLGLLAYYYYSQQPQTPFTYPVQPSPYVGDPGFVGPVAPGSITGDSPSVTQAIEQGVVGAVKFLGTGIKDIAYGVAAGSKWLISTIASTGPIGIAAAAAVVTGLVLIEVFRSNTHNVANEIVTQLENPFHQNLSSVIDPKDAAASAGTLTCDEESAAIQAIQALWSNYQNSVAEFETKGGDYVTVGEQSLANLNGPNGVIQYVPLSERYGANGFIDALIAKMQWHMANVLGC